MINNVGTYVYNIFFFISNPNNLNVDKEFGKMSNKIEYKKVYMFAFQNLVLVL